MTDWPSLFDRRVVIVFAHKIEVPGFADGTIELWDGPASPAVLVNGTPIEFCGVVDLSVCNAYALSEAIERGRENCASPYLPYDAHPVVWSEIYRSVLQALERFEMSYLEALEKVLSEYRRQSARGLVMSSQKVMRLYLKQMGQLPLAEGGPETMGGTGREPADADTRFLQQLVLRQSQTNRFGVGLRHAPHSGGLRIHPCDRW